MQATAGILVRCTGGSLSNWPVVLALCFAASSPSQPALRISEDLCCLLQIRATKDHFQGCCRELGIEEVLVLT